MAAALMAPLLGWDDQRREFEVERYLNRLRAERAAESSPDDAAASLARGQARDPRVLVAPSDP